MGTVVVNDFILINLVFKKNCKYGVRSFGTVRKNSIFDGCMHPGLSITGKAVSKIFIEGN